MLQGPKTMFIFQGEPYINQAGDATTLEQKHIFLFDFYQKHHEIQTTKLINISLFFEATKLLIFHSVGNCPVFTSDGFLDWKPCNISEASCPNSSYVSNEVYKCKTFFCLY